MWSDKFISTTNQRGSYSSVYSLGWIHGDRQHTNRESGSLKAVGYTYHLFTENTGKKCWNLYIYIYVYIPTSFLFWRDSPQWAMASAYTKFLDHTQRRTTVGRTPLDEWSDRRRDLYLTTHNTHNRQTSMSPVGFEHTVSVDERPQTYALDRAPTGTGTNIISWQQFKCNVKESHIHMWLDWMMLMSFR